MHEILSTKHQYIGYRTLVEPAISPVNENGGLVGFNQRKILPLKLQMLEEIDGLNLNSIFLTFSYLGKFKVS